MNETETTFTKIYNRNKTKLYRVEAEWNTNFFNLVVLEPNFAWSSEVPEEHLKTLAKFHELNLDTYYENVRKYICTDHSNTYAEVEDNQFLLYLQNPSQKFRLKYFFIKLDKVEYEIGVEQFLDKFNMKYLEALEKLKALQYENETISKEKILVEKRCTQFVELKRKSDLKMYSAFALLLNEKKQRIRFLTELLDEYTNGRKVRVEAKPLPLRNDVSNTQEAHSDHESNLSEGYNTDDEKKAKLNEMEAIPSTSKADYGFLGGDSPPPMLPKRVKVDKNVTETKDIVLSTFYEAVQKNDENKKSFNPEYDADTDEDEAVQFNTQDFLDKM